MLLSYEACYETTASNGAYRPYLEFNYAICDPNALCQTGGTCSCMPGYLGNGIQCTSTRKGRLLSVQLTRYF